MSAQGTLHAIHQTFVNALSVTEMATIAVHFSYAIFGSDVFEADRTLLVYIIAARYTSLISIPKHGPIQVAKSAAA